MPIPASTITINDLDRGARLSIAWGRIRRRAGIIGRLRIVFDAELRLLAASSPAILPINQSDRVGNAPKPTSVYAASIEPLSGERRLQQATVRNAVGPDRQAFVRQGHCDVSLSSANGGFRESPV